MPNEEYRKAVLKRFIVSPAEETAIVNTKLINDDVAPDDRQALIDYHPSTGPDYKVICDIVGKGPQSFLSVDPRGDGWNAKQVDLLRQMKFVPVPEFEVPGRKPVLMMMRSGNGNIRLSSTNWYLVNARLELTEINGKTLNDMILVWEYRAESGKEPYSKPVVTSWKWRSGSASG